MRILHLFLSSACLLGCYAAAGAVADRFDYPIGNRDRYTEANDGDGWYVAQEFGEWSSDYSKYHLGEDWNAESGGNTDCGLPVYAVANGSIVYASIASGWGRVLIVRHTLADGSQVESLYGHLGGFTKTSGDVVRGEQIGTIGDGSEGGTTYACHLHLELRTAVCPNWGQAGPGYSTTSKPVGWADPSDYIDAHRQALGLDDGLVAFYPFNGDANDASGNGHDGILLNGASFSNTPAGLALWVNSANQCVEIPYSPEMAASNYSIGAWVMPLTQAHGGQDVIFAQNYGHAQLVARPGSTGVKFALSFGVNHGTFYEVVSTNEIPIGQRTHLMGTWDGQNLRLYINGLFEAQATPGVTPVDSGCSFGIGGFYFPSSGACTYSGQFFEGIIDEARYYKRALSPAEVQTLYNGQPTQSVVSNIRASQRPGTQLVDIYYDLADAGNGPLAVTVLVSTDGGVSYTLPASRFSGSGWGNAVRPGSNKQIVWNAGADWGGHYSANVRFRVTADDAVGPSSMAFIPPGTFVMGSPTSEAERFADETQHTVTLTKGFYMGKYAVTQGEYLALMGSNPSYFTTRDYNGNPISPDLNRPVEQVSWNDATSYCAQLTAHEQAAGRLPSGWVYRLPTESEWEYACRAGTTMAFNFGSAIHGGMANFWDYYEYDASTGETYVSSPAVPWLPRTATVGSYQPNAWGLYDMHGNVYQWCRDWYGSYPTGNVTDPQGPNSSSSHVFRGGGWYGHGWYCRSANRGTYYPARSLNDIGFRVVLASGQQANNSADSNITPVDTRGVNANLSQVGVTPSSLPADGQNLATVTVTLLDGNGNPVSGKTVTVRVVVQTSSGAVVLSSVTQPGSATDANGQAVATFTSAVAGIAVVAVQDVTDGFALAQQPRVVLGSGLAAPGSDLADAIVQLANSSSNLLTHTIAGIATEEGGYGDYFWNKAGEDLISGGMTVLDAVGSQMWEAMGWSGGGEAEKELVLGAAKEVLLQLGHGAAADSVEGAIDILAGSGSGLTTYAQTICGDNTARGEAEIEEARRLLLGVPPAAASYTTDYVTDIGLRMQGNSVLNHVATAQLDLIASVKTSSDYSHTSFLKWLFKGVDVTTAAAGALVPVAKPLIVGISVGEADVQLASAARSLSIDQQGYNSAFISLAGASYLSCLIDANTESALNAITLGQRPVPVTGSVMSVDSKRLYVPATGVGGSILGWLWHTFANTIVAETVGGYSSLTIKNTGLQAAQFGVYAFFTNSIDLINDAGMGAGSIPVPIVVSVLTNIPAGQSVQLTLDYFNHPTTGMPDGDSHVAYSVIGYDGKGGLFAVGETSSTMSWQQASGASLKTPAHPDEPFPKELTNNFVSIDTLVTSFVGPNVTNQTYEAQIWVVNPFAIPLLAAVTQPLPPGVAVVSTDGMLGVSSIVWTNKIETNGLVGQSFSFRVSVPPGATTNLPPPTLVFSDETGTNSLTQTSAVVSFMGLFPVGVRSTIPGGTWGADTPAQLVVTNFTGASQIGTLAIYVTDTSGKAVANFNLPFAVGGLGATSLDYTLPGTLEPGAYMVIGDLSIGGGSGQVFSGAYVLSAAPVWFGGGIGTGVVPDGFTLELQGTPGYGYLIQTSTNLVDWEPAQYLVLTNRSGYFTDYYAPYYGQRFYRATGVTQTP